jgi:hypothetical protein
MTTTRDRGNQRHRLPAMWPVGKKMGRPRMTANQPTSRTTAPPRAYSEIAGTDPG